MKRFVIVLVLVSFTLAACGDLGRVSSAPDPFGITPSRTPRIITATPNIIIPTTSASLPPPPSLTASTLDLPPSATASATLTPTSTAFLPPTDTFTPSATNTNPPAAAPPIITLLGCDTGLDVTHGMGEVTNAYVTIANRGNALLTTVCATLSSADEGRAHPDKSKCVSSLPPGYQVTLKLTVDTTTNSATLVQVAFTSDQLARPSDPPAACPSLTSTPANLGVPVPIP